MRCVSLVLIFLVTAMASASDNTEKRYYDVANAENEFEVFISTHKKQYKDEADRQLHYQAFVTNLEKINKLNKDNPTAIYGINKFADYTEEEMESMRGWRPK